MPEGNVTVSKDVAAASEGGAGVVLAAKERTPRVLGLKNKNKIRNTTFILDFLASFELAVCVGPS